MSTPHPLNQAVIAQALHDLRHGRLRRCKAMGFGDQAIEALKYPELVSILANANVSWCSVSINQDVLHRLLSRVGDIKQEITTIDRMLDLGASTEMVSQFFGLTNQEVALRREVLGITKRKGRYPALSDEDDKAMWARWRAECATRHITPGENLDTLTLTLDLAEELDIPAAMIWHAMRNWLATEKG